MYVSNEMAVMSENNHFKNRLTDWRTTTFIMILLSCMVFFPVSNGIFFAATKTVGIPGDKFGFLCADPSHTALSVKWLVNGTLLENSALEILFQNFDNLSKIADLNFNLTLEHNVTTIQCIVIFASENVSSETITLLLQGLLSVVGFPLVNLGNTEFSLTWTAPFTLDISNVDPDIRYCVDVVNSTSSSTVFSECGITVTGFNFSIPMGRMCDNYTFTVTPVNGAGNGTAITLGYSITVPVTREGLLRPQLESTYQVTMSAPVCDGELIAINDYTEEETSLRNDSVITIKTITFTSEGLKKNQLYTVYVNASNINGSAVSYVRLSTHGVMNATFDVTSHTITTLYFEYSIATGTFCIFIFINEDRSIDFKKSIYLPLDRNSSHNYTLSDIFPGQYRMFVYDIGVDATLHDSVSYPANTDMFFIISDDTQDSYSQNTSLELLDCNVTSVDSIISAMCSYSGGSSVTGFQMIVQSNNVDEVHKLHINSTTAPGPVTVQVNENASYHVAIFPIMKEAGIVDTTIAYSEVLSITEPQIPETSKENSQGWIIAVGVVVPLVLIGIIAGIGYLYYRNCGKVHCFSGPSNNESTNHSGDKDSMLAGSGQLTAIKPKQEGPLCRRENDEFRHLYDSEDSISTTVHTFQDYGSSVPFMSQCGPLQDPSSAMTTIKTCSTDNSTRVHGVKSSHIALKPATNIFNDSNVELVYLKSSDKTCSINDGVCKLSSEVTYANNVDVSNERVSMVARVEIQNEDRESVDDRQCHSLNKTVLACVAEEQHEEYVQSQEKVLSSPERDPMDQEMVPSLSERKHTDSSSPERESINQEIVPSSSKRKPTDIEIAPSLLKRGSEIALSAPSDKKETTDKEIFPSSNKNRLVDRRATMFIILLIFVMFLPVSMATNDVHLFYTKTVGIPGDNFTFYCSDQSRTALSIQWLVNGTLLEKSRLVNVFQHFNNMSKTAELSFNLPLEHNVTTIQCNSVFFSEKVSSEIITLLLQGLLAAVGSPSVDLIGTDIFLTWTAPFTLDISDVDPDITYCVDVVDSTSSSRVLSECGITVTGFDFSIPLGRVCDNLNITFTVTVTPVNGAGNGTAVTLGYSQDMDITVPRASTEFILPIAISTYQITMSAPVCYGELTAINDNTGDETHIQGNDLNIIGNTITFTSEKLNKNQLYAVSVNASNINGSAVSNVSLSTHDVMNVTFDVTSHTITTEYFEYSTAMGALYIFIFINEDNSIDFKKSIYLPLDSSSFNYTLPAIYPGQYYMFVYDIDSDITFHDGADCPAITNNFSIISDETQAFYSQNTSSEFIRDCSVNYENGVISAVCSYSNDSSVTGFQMIVQLYSIPEVRKLYINGTKKQRSSPEQVTTELEESGIYHVSIFPLMERGIVGTTVAHIQIIDSETSISQTMVPEISKESSQGWIIAVGVVVLLVLIIIIGIIAGTGIGYILHYRKHYLRISPLRREHAGNYDPHTIPQNSKNDKIELDFSTEHGQAPSANLLP